MIRRDRLILRLEEQKALLQDPAYLRTVQRWVEQDGQKRQVEKQQKVRPWWRTDSAGNVVMSVHFGTKPIELEKGKAGIAVPSKEKLAALIDTLSAAVKAGEVDEASRRRRSRATQHDGMTERVAPIASLAQITPYRRAGFDGWPAAVSF
jgi:Family of unknown function (DUF6641)